MFEWCVDNGIILTICSRCPDQNVVKAILDALEMWEWFLLPQIYASKKTHHFRALKQSIGCKYSDFIFFDDDVNNVNICGKIGVNCVQVDKYNGLNWDTLIEGLELFQTNQKSKFALYATPTSCKSVNYTSSGASSINETSFSTVESIDSVNGESTNDDPIEVSYSHLGDNAVHTLMSLSRQPSFEA